jgi:ubiquinone/menaquinone biosynthesis C-methylase UbiE
MIPFDKVTHFKTTSFAKLLDENYNPKKILVVGCGNGTEVTSLNKFFPGSKVYGIDLKVETINENDCFIEPGDAENLRFADKEFDLIYSFHVLEHISNPTKALTEMNRVLQDNGCLLIGTPNRKRLVGYISSANTSLMTKIQWNFIDWKAKVKGKFRNELGAHAGFSHSELNGMLSKNFSVIKNVSQAYYEEIYRTKKNSVKWLYKLGLNDYLLPAVYFLAKK